MDSYLKFPITYWKRFVSSGMLCCATGDIS